MAVFTMSDVDDVLGKLKQGGGFLSRAVANAARTSYRNRSMLRSTQQFSSDQLVERLQKLASDSLALEKVLKEVKAGNAKDRRVREIRNLLQTMDLERAELNNRLNALVKF